YVKAKAVTNLYVLAETTILYLDGVNTVVLESEVYPSSAAQKVEWKSSDTEIATVNKTTGKVTAKKAGEVTIYAKAVDGSKVQGEIDITVKENTVTYRALLIGEEHFFGDHCGRNAGDVKQMASLLGRVVGPKGGKYKVTKKLDLGFNDVQSAIKSAFGSATEKDVSLFFIATHGNSDGDGELALVDGRAIPFEILASWLKTIKGKVIVILESCGAGSAIYDPEEQNNAAVLKANAAKEEAASKAFVSAAVRAFSAADPGVAANSTGDLRDKKFYVLAAARHHEMSWGMESMYGEPYNYFTKWLVEGVGTASQSPADTDKNRRITLTELFNYISRVGDSYPFESAEETYYQHVQRYPVGSTYQLFRFK
ncbi:MAG: Ig-like domain-containing protein, partial [Clostridiales bacterium]|nr:Ig-like domain-containing protein [Clostridiales bacterium]